MGVDISVIMPVYNAECYLEHIIQDVLSQSISNFEFIIIDDGSTDRSREICDYYAGIDSRIRFFSIENQGVSFARNFGIHKAHGKYIRFVDSDDRLENTSLEFLMVPIKENEKIDLVIGKYSVDCNFYTGDCFGEKERGEFISHFLKYIPSFYYGVVWNKLYKTSIIKENKIEFVANLQFAEDMRFNCEYYKYCKKIFYVDYSVYNYIRRDSSLTDISTKRPLCEQLESELERIEVVWELIVLEKNTNYDSVLNDYLFSRLHMALSGVFIFYEKSSHREIFLRMISSDYILRLLDRCHHKSSYVINSFLAWGIRKKHYRILYAFYSIKNTAKRNVRIREYLQRSEKYQRKFPL